MLFPAAATELTLATTGAWTDCDLNALCGVPLDASFAVLHVIHARSGSTPAIFSFRANGSSDSVLDTTGISSMDNIETAIVPLTAGVFEYYINYATGASNLRVVYVGHFSSTEATRFLDSVDITPTDPGYPAAHPLLNGWKQIDVSAVLPSTAVLAVCKYIDTALSDGYERHGFGVRVPGSAEYIDPDNYYYNGSAGGNNPSCCFLAPVSGGKIEVFGQCTRSSGAYNRKIRVYGYIDAATINSSISTTDAQDWLASSSSWQDRTISRKCPAVYAIFQGRNYGSPAYFPKFGVRQNGETGAYTGNMDGEIEDFNSHMPMVIPLDSSQKFEEWIQLTGTPSGKRAYIMAYFEASYGVDETATATDTLGQDMYTPSADETAAATDTLRAGEEYTPTGIDESATATDTVAGQVILGGRTDEAATATDEVVGERMPAGGVSDIQIDFIEIEGEGLHGAISDSPALDVLVDQAEEDCLSGFISSGGSLEIGVEFPYDGVGLWGGISDEATLDSILSILGTGLWGGVGSAGVTDIVLAIAAASAGPTGFIGTDGGIYAFVDISADTGFSGSSGSGSLYIAVEVFSSGVFPTALPSGERQWYVFPVNITNMAPTMHDTPFSSMVVVGNQRYATGPDGIHLIGENTDNGVPIVANLTKGPVDFGNSQIKMASDVYMGLVTDGNLQLEIFGDGMSGSVTLEDTLSRRPHGAKSDLPRGVTGRALTFTITNVNGVYFELSDIEFLIMLSEVRRARQTSG